ncbi:MAG: hypothetical protein LBD02_01855 [Christensenellaceae bacterium]|nr:hypothetical protein [Christensenellaceae bacterium]
MKCSVKKPALFDVLMPDGAVTPGGTQDWFREEHPRRGGCGATAGANLVWYLARSRACLSSLCRVGGGTQAEMLALMEEMFGFITPGRRGVDSSAMFTEGAVAYGEKHGARISPEVLELPEEQALRPSLGEVFGFLRSALERDLPLAFLNLSNGEVETLDGWHWVVISAADEETGRVTIHDDARAWEIDLALWLRTTTLGGALVALNAMAL